MVLDPATSLVEPNPTEIHKDASKDVHCSLFFSPNKLIYLFIYLFLAALGLCFCAWAFSSCGERGLVFVVVRGLLTAVTSRCGAWVLGAWASVVAAHRLSSCGSWALERRLSSCGSRA